MKNNKKPREIFSIPNIIGYFCILLMLFLPGLPDTVSNLMIVLMIMIGVFSWIMYIRFHIGMVKNKDS